MSLIKILGFTPVKASLYHQALTHPSASAEHNQRLEFLGDAVLGAVISTWLYEQRQECDEGVLSRLKAKLCCEEAMASYGDMLGIKALLMVKQQEIADQSSVIADAFEAFCGAMFLDRGYPDTAAWVLQHIGPLFAKRLEEAELKDPKTQLQELMQRYQRPLPSYELLKTQGPPNAMTFFVRAIAAGHEAQAQAPTKRAAQQRAAQMLLDKMNQQGDLSHG